MSGSKERDGDCVQPVAYSVGGRLAAGGRESGERPTLKSPRILVTGGAGFIGANLVRMLLDRGKQVTVLDDLSACGFEYLEGLPIEFIKGNILDADLVNRVVPGHHGIVHLAAQTGVPGSLADPRTDCDVNVIGTLNMLEAARAFKIPRFLFASSNAPLGRQSPPASEDKVPRPISPYGASKLAGEAYCLAYHGSWGLRTVVLRFANLYGPFSAHKTSVVAAFFNDISAKGQITIQGDGEQTRDFIHVDDVCRASMAALDSKISGEVFQIASGLETSILELASIVQGLVGKAINVRHKSERQSDIKKNYSVVTKAGTMLGWTSQMELSAGLRNTWEWFKKWPAQT